MMLISDSNYNEKGNIYYKYNDGVKIYLNYEGSGKIQSVFLNAGDDKIGYETLFVTNYGYGHTSVKRVFNKSSPGTACGSTNYTAYRGDKYCRKDGTLYRRNQETPDQQSYEIKSGEETTFLDPNNTGFSKNKDGEKVYFESGSPISDSEFESLKVQFPPEVFQAEFNRIIWAGYDKNDQTTRDFILLTRVAALALIKRNNLQPTLIVPSVISGYDDGSRVYRNNGSCFHFIANGRGNLDYIYIHDENTEKILLKTDGSGFIRYGETIKIFDFSGNDDGLRSMGENKDLPPHSGCPTSDIDSLHHMLFARMVLMALAQIHSE